MVVSGRETRRRRAKLTTTPVLAATARDRRPRISTMRDVPAYEDALAYFITFTCHGTWLHGDQHGSILHRGHEHVHEVAPDESRRKLAQDRMKSGPMLLDLSRRHMVDDAIRETCEFHGWLLRALNVRTNHVHLVVSSDVIPDRVMNAAKGWATTRLKRAGLMPRTAEVWTRGGSTRYLWRDDDVNAACRYVLERQGPDLV